MAWNSISAASRSVSPMPSSNRITGIRTCGCPGRRWLDISADGSTLVYLSMPTQSALALWVLSLPDGEPQLFIKDAAGGARFSPLGGWLAFAGAGPGGRPAVYLQSFSTPDKRFPVSNGPGEHPIWSRDGKELFYQAGRKMMVVDVSASAGNASVGQPRALFDLPLGTGNRTDGGVQHRAQRAVPLQCACRTTGTQSNRHAQLEARSLMSR